MIFENYLVTLSPAKKLGVNHFCLFKLNPYSLVLYLLVVSYSQHTLAEELYEYTWYVETYADFLAYCSHSQELHVSLLRVRGYSEQILL